MGSSNDRSPDPGNGTAMAGAKTRNPDQTTRSGRGFVIIVGLWIIGITLTLFMVFRQWRGEYENLAAYGRERVATAVDPLKKTVPAGVTPLEWGSMVEQVHAVLVDLTASGSLDLAQMRALRREIQERINGARPETAPEALSSLWNALEDQAGPILTSRARYGLASAIRPLAELQPPDLPSEEWALAVVQTRAMLAALAHPKPLPQEERERLRGRIDTAMAASIVDNPPDALRAVWRTVREAGALPAGFSQLILDTPRPASDSTSSAPAAAEP